MVKDDAGIIIKEDIDDAVDMLISDKIDMRIFISNLGVLVGSSSFSYHPLSKEPSPFIFLPDMPISAFSASRRILVIPLWFYAAYPDVMKWLHELKEEREKSPNFNVYGKMKIIKLFGVKIWNMYKENHLNTKGQWRPKYLKNLVRNYLKKTGNNLNLTVEKFSEDDIYSNINNKETKKIDDQSWDSLTPRELRIAKIISISFLVISILIVAFLSKIVGGVMLFLWIISGFGPFVLGSRGAIKNKIHVLKIVEPGYNDWEDEEIIEQIKAIDECGYRWFEQKGRVGFKHTKTGLYLKIEGLHYYKPEEIKRAYKDVWSKADPKQVRKRDITCQKLAESILSGATNKEIESILEEHHKQKKTK